MSRNKKKRIWKRFTESRFVSFLDENKAYIFIGIILLFITFFIISLQEKKYDVEIDLSFSYIPPGYEKVFLLTTHMQGYQPAYEDVFSVLGEHDMPLSIFLVTNYTQDFNTTITSILGAADENDLQVSLEIGGFADKELGTLDYAAQEAQMKSIRKEMKKYDLRPYGIMAPGFSYSYDTFLAAENNNLDFVITSQAADAAPYHPPSLLGGLMGLLVLPLYGGKEISAPGVYTLFLNLDSATQNSEDFEQFVTELAYGKGIWSPTIKEFVDYVGSTEKQSALITSDRKKLVTNLEFRELINNSRIALATNLQPTNITVGNRTLTPTIMETEGGFAFEFVLDKRDNYLYIEWAKPESR